MQQYSFNYLCTFFIRLWPHTVQRMNSDYYDSSCSLFLFSLLFNVTNVLCLVQQENKGRLVSF